MENFLRKARQGRDPRLRLYIPGNHDRILSSRFAVRARRNTHRIANVTSANYHVTALHGSQRFSLIHVALETSPPRHQYQNAEVGFAYSICAATPDTSFYALSLKSQAINFYTPIALLEPDSVTCRSALRERSAVKDASKLIRAEFESRHRIPAFEKVPAG